MSSWKEKLIWVNLMNLDDNVVGIVVSYIIVVLIGIEIII